MESDFNSVQEGLIAQREPWITVEDIGCACELRSGQPPEEELSANITEPPKRPGYAKWTHAIVAQHIDRLGVIAEERRSTARRSPPQRLAPKGELIVLDAEGDIAFEQSPASHSRNRPFRRRRSEVRGCDLLLCKRIWLRC